MRKHDRIVASQRRAARNREAAPTNDVLLGLFFVGMGYVLGPPIAGIVVGMPLLIMGVWGIVRGGYSSKRPFQERFWRNLNEDIDRVSRGNLPRHAPMAREHLKRARSGE